MRDGGRKKNGPSFGRRLFIIGLGSLFLVMLVTTFFGKKGWMDIKLARNRYEVMFQEMKRLEQEKMKLEKEIEELEKNPRAVERKAREDLWLMHPDEKVIVRSKKTVT